MHFGAQCFEALSQMHLKRGLALLWRAWPHHLPFLTLAQASDGDTESVFQNDLLQSGGHSPSRNSETMFWAVPHCLGLHLCLSDFLCEAVISQLTSAGNERASLLLVQGTVTTLTAFLLSPHGRIAYRSNSTRGPEVPHTAPLNGLNRVGEPEVRQCR